LKRTNSEDRCPVCAARSVAAFLCREQVPVHQNLVIKDQQAAVSIARGDLELAVCEECGFIFNRAFEPSLLSYGGDYENTQACSPFFRAYLDTLVSHLILEKGVRNSRIVEVGCGDGLFLRSLVEAEGAGNSGYGFDPSYTGPASDLEGRLQFRKRDYGPECVGIFADVVVCRHVIEHVPDPLGLLRTIRLALVNSPHARVFLETPCVEWILRNQVIWDFFYEHCSYFTAESLTTAFQASGFRVEDVRHVFEGQYLWVEATVAKQGAVMARDPGSIPALARQFMELEGDLEGGWRTRIQQLACKGKVALWGAGAKGMTFANLIDPTLQWIDCVVDLNPRKQGHYVPGTGHPIVGYQELADRGVTVAILMNPNYRHENLVLLRTAHLDIDLIE